MESPGTIIERVIQNYLRRFKKNDTNLEEKRSGRLCIMEDKDLLLIVEQETKHKLCPSQLTPS